jgi:ketosteroid isomerase-like protein
MKALASLACIALLGLCGPTFAQAQSASPDPTVDELAARWTSSYNNRNAEAIAGLYAPGAELYVHKEGRYVGRDAIRAYWAQDFNVLNPMTVLTVTDSVVDAEMMLVHGNYQVLNRTTGVPQTRGRFAHIWIRDASGKWLLDRDLWNQSGAN